MKKIIFSILILFFVLSIAFAGPFGLSKSMSVSEVSKLSERGCEPTRISDDDRYLFVPKKKHELFKTYVAFIDEDNGLYAIRAISEDIKTTKYGTELKDAFNAMVERLSKIYGTPKKTDKIDPNYYWKKDEYWLTALREGARELSAIWKKGEKGANLPDELAGITIYIEADKIFENGVVIIEYGFSNYSEVQEKQDDVL